MLWVSVDGAEVTDPFARTCLRTQCRQWGGDQTAVNSVQDYPISDAFTESVTWGRKAPSLNHHCSRLGEVPAPGSRAVFFF